jgi:hypothetical protein
MDNAVYRVTRHPGSTPTTSHDGVLLYSTADQDVAWKFYSLLRPMLGMAIALWQPDGILLASKAGPHRQARTR